jgi:aspartyl/asparaginyl beta-hydroxylase (cupin superfamily)
MTIDSTDPVANLIRQADTAAAQGRLSDAGRLLDAALTAQPNDVDTWLKRAAICRGQGDLTAALTAAEGALRADPLNFMALLLRANLLEKLGQPDANEAYGYALAQQPAEPPPHLRTMLEHGAARYAAFQRAQDHALVAALDRVGLTLSEDEGARVERFRTNATRMTRVYHSEPTDYHYPGLREREFHESALFPWIAALEAATVAITQEFETVVAAEQAELTPYIQYAPGQPVRQWAPLNQSRDWTAIHLIRNGLTVAANARHCPITMALMARLPQPKIAGASPNVMFSLLAPHTHIPPHHGINNTRLVCHLPLIIPPDCWFRVGAGRRTWEMGRVLVFDDTIEHEAMNGSDQLRVVLIFDIWHPDLSRGEQDAVATLIAAHGQSIT